MIKHYHVDDETIADGDIMNIVDPMWYGVSIYDGLQTYEQDISRFTENQKHLHAMIWYQCEVNNGGHDQFFFNSTGIVWKNALDGFRKIGFDAAAEILQEAVSLLGGTPSFDRTERQEQLDGLSDNDYDRLGDLDSRFYDIADFDDYILRFINENKKDFYFDGDIDIGEYRGIKFLPLNL